MKQSQTSKSCFLSLPLQCSEINSTIASFRSENTEELHVEVNKPRVLSCHVNCLNDLVDQTEIHKERNTYSLNQSYNSTLSDSKVHLHQKCYEINQLNKRMNNIQKMTKQTLSPGYVPTHLDNKQLSNTHHKHHIFKSADLDQNEKEKRLNNIPNNNEFTPFYQSYQIEYI